MSKKFAHEELHESLCFMFGRSPDDPPEVIYSPYIDELQRRQKELSQHFRAKSVISLLEDTADERSFTYDFFANATWWELFPYLLTPKRVNFEEAAAYMMYRLFTTGNAIYRVTKPLVNALYNTDFEFRLSDIDFPHETFIVYWGDNDSNILLNDNKHPVQYTFADVISLPHGLRQLRLVYGHIDDDGDEVNSGIMTLTIESDTKVSSKNFFQQMESITYSELSQMEVNPMYRTNNAKVYVLMFNFLLYLSAVPEDREVIWPHPDFRRMKGVSNPKKRRRLEKELKKESSYRHLYIGREYERQIAQNVSEQHLVSDGAKLDHMVLVRGHWRHQWYGPREKVDGIVVRPGTSQKTVWIQPFWKGTGDTDEKIVVYNVR